jgi:hypothetical protein
MTAAADGTRSLIGLSRLSRAGRKTLGPIVPGVTAWPVRKPNSRRWEMAVRTLYQLRALAEL